MQEDANRGVPRGPGGPVVNASTASFRHQGLGAAGRLIIAASGLVVLAMLAAMFL